jgi:hypothetical protein
MRNHAAGTDTVDNVDGLAELLLEPCRDDARDGVGAAARRPRHEQRDRPFGPGSMGDGGREESQQDGGDPRQHRFLPIILAFARERQGAFLHTSNTL